MESDQAVTLRNMREICRQFRRILSVQEKGDIHFVTDRANWAFYWVTYYLMSYLNERMGLNTVINHNPWRLKETLIHFIDRYAYFHGSFHKMHPSNQVFLTWFHGDPTDPNPAMRRLFEILPEGARYLRKIVVSCQISREVLLKCEVPEEKLVLIPLGVDLDQFSPPTEGARLRAREALGIPEGTICVGSFQKDGAGWEEGLEPKYIKGPDIFLEVVERLFSCHKNLMVLLTGPARGYVKKGLEKAGIPYIHKYLAHYHDIVSHYQALDLYLITSRCEGGPQALLESWATGVPVVSTRVGMPADLLDHGENGMLAEVEDVETLSKHAMQLIEDVRLREKCRKQGLEEVAQYGWPSITERYYQELYKPFIQNRG